MKSFRNQACSWRSLAWRRNWGREAAALLSVRLLNKGWALELLTYNANELNKYYDSLPLCSGCFLTFFFFFFKLSGSALLVSRCLCPVVDDPRLLAAEEPFGAVTETPVVGRSGLGWLCASYLLSTIHCGLAAGSGPPRSAFWEIIVSDKIMAFVCRPSDFQLCALKMLLQ